MNTRLHASLFALLAVTACHERRAVDTQNFADGVNRYLERRGDLCVGKAIWPVDVTRAESVLGSRDALQMPVLERLGLVYGENAVSELQTEDGPVKREVRRYTLTSAGQRYYIARGGASGAPAKRDFCVARLSLDHVVGWEPTTGDLGAHTVVSYTYHADAPPWTSDPDVVRTFPMVDRVLRGAGTARLTEAFTLTSSGWVADDLLKESTAPAAVARAEGRSR